MNLSRTARTFLTLAVVAFFVATLIIVSPVFAAHGESATGKKAILLVAFGTSVPEAQPALRNIDEEVRKAFPKTEVRWAYTAKIIRKKLLKEEGRRIDSPAEALAKLGEEGFSHVAVQSLHTIPGEEFHALSRIIRAFHNMPKGTQKVTLGTPLLTSHEDMQRATDALFSIFPKERKPCEAVVLMGHGTHHAGNIYYPGLQHYLSRKDTNVFVGTVEGYPSLDDIIAELRAKKITNVWLMPLMSVAGDHARNDMAGPEEDSWASVLKKEGVTVRCTLKGTAEYDSIVARWIAHLQSAFARL